MPIDPAAQGRNAAAARRDADPRPDPRHGACISPAAAIRCPGDRIVGIVTTGKGVTIHTIDCDTLESFSDAPERWLDVAWDAGADADDGACRPHPA